MRWSVILVKSIVFHFKFSFLKCDFYLKNNDVIYNHILKNITTYIYIHNCITLINNLIFDNIFLKSTKTFWLILCSSSDKNNHIFHFFINRCIFWLRYFFMILSIPVVLNILTLDKLIQLQFDSKFFIF